MSSPSITDVVTAATVTYGDRSATCLRVARAALEAGAERCVVVDNGSVPASRDALAQAAAADVRLTLVRLPSNEGSAAGFAVAIDEARRSACDRIWLLDDDNLPRPGALAAALETAHRHGVDAAVACLRSDDPLQRAVAEGRPVARTIAFPGSFLGFDLLERLRPTPAGASPEGAIEVPWAPYGGLLLPAPLVRRVQLPYACFVLYGDDRDYCARLRAAGARIWLEPAAVVDDLVDRWGETSTPERGQLARMVQAGDDHRAFHLVRNTVFEDVRSARAAGALPRVVLNAAVHTAFTVATAVRERRPAYLRVHLGAVVAGVRGRWYRPDAEPERAVTAG